MGDTANRWLDEWQKRVDRDIEHMMPVVESVGVLRSQMDGLKESVELLRADLAKFHERRSALVTGVSVAVGASGVGALVTVLLGHVAGK
jgi:hypothetical protein